MNVSGKLQNDTEHIRNIFSGDMSLDFLQNPLVATKVLFNIV